MPSVLNQLQLQRLSEHKYSAGGVSFVEPALQIYWRWLVEQVPLTWAPNSMTIAGLIINIVTTLILVYYSPSGKEEVCVVCSVAQKLHSASSVTVLSKVHDFCLDLFFNL